MSDDRVIDASALVLALIGKTDGADAVRQRLRATRRPAPHLIDVEVGNVLRRHERGGRISTRRRKRHWANLSFSDALCVALAARLGVPLITADARLASAPGLPCEFEIV